MTSRWNSLFPALIAANLGAPACTRSTPPPPSPAVATFSWGDSGSTELTVTARDVELLSARDRCGGETPPPSRALAGFIESGAQHLLARALGLYPSPEELRAESRRIGLRTRDPKTLECIQSLYKKDGASYLRLFVAPILVDRKLLEHFNSNPKENGDDYHAWLRARAKLIRVRIPYPVLYSDLKTQFPEAWWAPLLTP